MYPFIRPTAVSIITYTEMIPDTQMLLKKIQSIICLDSEVKLLAIHYFSSFFFFLDTCVILVLIKPLLSPCFCAI